MPILSGNSSCSRASDSGAPRLTLHGKRRFVDLSGIRRHPGPFCSNTGRPSIDPELPIRMLLAGYCLGIRSGRRLCEEVHLNLVHRWSCRFDLADGVPDHSTFSKNRHGRFRDSDVLRQLFEMTVARCISEGVVSGQHFAADARLIEADANKQNPTAKADRKTRLRGPNGANDEFPLAGTARNLRKLARILPAPQKTRKA